MMDLQFIEDDIYREFAESHGLPAQSTETAVVAKTRDDRGELADIFDAFRCICGHISCGRAARRF